MSAEELFPWAFVGAFLGSLIAIRAYRKLSKCLTKFKRTTKR
jgi:hypothetical protein